MARSIGGQIVASISSVLPPRQIAQLAGELGVVKRQRKVDIVRFVQALVLGFRFERVRSLSGLRRAYQLMVGQSLARSSFHGRFTQEFAALMRRLATEAIEGAARQRRRLRATFRPFVERMNKEGAVSGMIVGLVFTAAYIVYFKFISPDLNTSEHWLFGVSPEGIGTLGMLLNFVVAFVVSSLTPAPPENIRELVHSIRVPRGS